MFKYKSLASFLKGTQNLTSVLGFPKFPESFNKFSNKSLTFNWEKLAGAVEESHLELFSQT